MCHDCDLCYSLQPTEVSLTGAKLRMTAGEGEAFVNSSEACESGQCMPWSRPDIGKAVDTGEAKPSNPSSSHCPPAKRANHSTNRAPTPNLHPSRRLQCTHSEYLFFKMSLKYFFSLFNISVFQEEGGRSWLQGSRRCQQTPPYIWWLSYRKLSSWWGSRCVLARRTEVEWWSGPKK